MKLCRRSERIRLAFSLEECADHVSEDVRDELAAHNAEYMQHMTALQQLDFFGREMPAFQQSCCNILNDALGKLESVVCDSLWAGGILSTFQLAVTPDFLPSVFLTEYRTRLFRRETLIMALADLRQAYYWLRMCLPEDSHKCLEGYVKEQFRGLRLIAAATVKHGFEFGLQVLEKGNFSVAERDIKAFYELLG